jgi:hypothetical protein
MEHLIFLLIHFVIWLDSLSIKPLKKAVPNLGQLFANPRGVLAVEPITIGPVRRYASAIALGLLIAVLLWATIAIVVVVGLDIAGQRQQKELAIGLLLCVPLILIPACIWVMIRVLRGATLVASSEGVEIHYRGAAVKCPWSLFHVTGQPFRPKKDRVLLPVAAAAIPLIELHRRDSLVEQGTKVKTPFLAVKAGNHLSLRALFEVDALEVGTFLLQLGPRLGEPLRPGATALLHINGTAPVAESTVNADDDGWLVITLTRLHFPPFCCECGTACSTHREFRGQSSLLRLGPLRLDGTEFVRVSVPVCQECQDQFRSSYRRMVLRGSLFGLAAPLLPGVVASAWLRSPFPILASAILALLLALIGYAIGRRKALRDQPVRLERYTPNDGTVAIRFRKPEYQEAVVEFMS